MIYDFYKFSDIKCEGVDISEYAINNCKDEVKDFLKLQMQIIYHSKIIVLML